MKPTHVNQGEMQDADIPNSDIVAIEYFKQLMAKERQKPIDEQNFDLIDECIKNIAELKGVRSGFTEDEIEHRLGALLNGIAEKEDVEKNQTAPDPVLRVTARKRTVRFRPLIAAVVAVVLLVAGCLTAYATVPCFRNWILKLLDMPVGSSIGNNKIEYIHTGQAVVYENIEALIVTEQLPILYPYIESDDIYVKSIKLVEVEEKLNYLFVFNNPKVSLMVSTNFFGTIESAGEYQLYQSGDITAHYWLDELMGGYLAVFVYNECYYSVSAPDVETLILILDHMKGV